MKVSCLVVTQESRWPQFLAACRCFLNQSWPDKELVVAADGRAEYRARLTEFCAQSPAPAALVFPEDPLPLGQLRNLSLEAATGELICQWDDDDLYHPRRLETQVHALIDQHADLCLFTDYWHHFVDTGELYWTDLRFGPDGAPWKAPHLQTFPGSLLARREIMPKYPPHPRGEDSVLLAFAAIRRLRFALVSGLGWNYVYQYHGNNTWQRQHHEDLLRKRGRILKSLHIDDLPRPVDATADWLPRSLAATCEIETRPADAECGCR